MTYTNEDLKRQYDDYISLMTQNERALEIQLRDLEAALENTKTQLATVRGAKQGAEQLHKRLLQCLKLPSPPTPPSSEPTTSNSELTRA